MSSDEWGTSGCVVMSRYKPSGDERVLIVTSGCE